MIGCRDPRQGEEQTGYMYAYAYAYAYAYVYVYVYVC